MKKLIYLFWVAILLTSCATLLNPSHTRLTVCTNEPSEIIFNSDTFNTVNNKTTLYVQRQKKALNIVARNDSLEKHLHIKPINSFAYWYNIVCNYGIGMLVDKNNPK